MAKNYNLVGIDGNAFSVMGYTRKAMKELGYSDSEIKSYADRAMQSDYIEHVDYDKIYPIKFLDICIVYDHLREILSSTEDKKVFMSASF